MIGRIRSKRPASTLGIHETFGTGTANPSRPPRPTTGPSTIGTALFPIHNVPHHIDPMTRCNTALIVVLFSSWLVHPVPSAATTKLRRGVGRRRRRRAHKDNDHPRLSSCPANQIYRTKVPYGCSPVSCDEPIPQCDDKVTAVRRPGCGCPDGTVLAGSSSSMMNHDRCIPPHRCRPKERERPVATTTTTTTSSLTRCVVSGCNGEICTAAGQELLTICIAPTCEVSCLVQFGTCTNNTNTTTTMDKTTSGFGDDNDHGIVSSLCGWNTGGATEREYQECVAGCAAGEGGGEY
jgi:hypothetical protein